MKPVYCQLSILLAFLFIVNGLSAQISPDTLTNSKIMHLVRAKLSESVILQKINNSPCSFDVSADALIDLKNNQVSDTVINRMIQKQGLTNTNPALASLPVGTEVKYQITTSNESSVPFVHYYDDQQNDVNITKVSSGWAVSFKTTKPNQELSIACSAKAHSNWFHYVPGPVQLALAGKDHPSITAVIYINGIQVKQATGQFVVLRYPR
jgi:hypothetical protein